MEETRIIIKNIPKFLKDKELSEQFSSVGDLTDCKILRTNKGKSRGFAFVGYKTHEQAQKAIDSFNNTFIHTSKIQVDFAKPIGDESLEESYARIRKAPKGNKKNKTKESEDNDIEENNSSKLKRPSYEDDPDFQEFLAARRAKNTWNEGLSEYLEQHKRDIEMENQKKKRKAEESEDESNEQLQNNEDNNEEEEEVKYSSTRVYITNVHYSTTESDLEKFFSKYGKVIEVQIPYDKIAQRSKGIAFVTFADFEGMENAMKDSIILQGRHLKLKPADPPPNQSNDSNDSNKIDDDEPYLKKKRRLLKIEKPESWNMLFLNKDTVAEAAARMLGFTKSQILNPESDDIASRLAIAESQLVNDTKEMFQKAGIDLSLFDRTNSSSQFSKTLIIVKNLKYETTEDEVRNMFAAYGSLVRFIFPPTHAVALVEFARPEDARKAYTGLAYKKLHDQPFFLQWAPAPQSQFNHLDDNNEDEETRKVSSKQLKTTTLIVKNVPFKATKKEIYDLVNAYAKVKAVRMPKKSDGSGHKGFVFLDFNTRQEATSAMDNLGNIHLYDRHLVVQPAEVGRNADSIVQQNIQKE